MEKEKILNEARKIAIINASKYGKTSAEFIIPKIIGTFRELKDKINDYKADIQRIVEEVNKMSLEEIREIAKDFQETKDKKEERKLLKYENAVTRFSPEPSGYLHLGHAKAAFLSYEIAAENNGVMYLRFDDTNPEKAKEEYVKMILEDLEWLNIKPYSITYTSDYVDGMYEKMEELIKKDKAYVCQCKEEEINENRKNKKACDHRNQEVKENLRLFGDMKNGKVKEKEAILLYKGDLNSDNTALRDPAIARIVEKEHFRHKNKKLWPTYHFASVYMDAIQEITHAIRSKEYELYGSLYFLLLNDLFPGKKIELIHISRLFVPGYPLSKREMRKLIEEKKIESWDDPRLLTLRALKRRGISSKAIKDFVLSFGLGKQENPADLSILYSKNRAVIDEQADRYFFIEEPFPLKIEGDFPEFVKMKKHPRKNEEKIIRMNDTVYIEKSDFEKLEDNELVMLKGFSVAKVDKKERKISLENKSLKWLKVIRWLPSNFASDALIIEPRKPLNDDGTFNEKSLLIRNGKVEKNVEGLAIGSIVQFEMLYFCILDKIEKGKFSFIFTS
jgi:glutamyl-tRNA synthetase